MWQCARITENRGLEGLHLQPSIPWHSEILSRIEQTWQACVHEFPHYELTARSRLSELLSFLVDQLSQEPVRSNQKHARNADRIKQMLQYIHDITLVEKAVMILRYFSDCAAPALL